MGGLRRRSAGASSDDVATVTMLVAKIATATAALGAAACLGAYLRPCPACGVQEKAHEDKKQVAAQASSSAASSVAEAKPKTIYKRWPVIIPMPAGAPPGCPTVAMAEEVETSADSRITQAATQQAAASVVQEASKEHEAVRSAPVEREWTAGFLVGVRLCAGERGPLSFTGVVSRRMVGPFGIAAQATWTPGEAPIVGAGVTWSF